MILGKLLNLALPPEDEHLATTWEIATDYAFKNIIVKSEDDTLNKTSIVFKNIVPMDGKPYYGRAKIRTKKEGWSIWHNLDITINQKLDTIDNIHTLPSVIGIPRIKTQFNGKPCDLNQHPITHFQIELDGYATINNTKHISTSWFIETLEGNVIWKSVKNAIDKLKISIEDVLLEYNKAYKIRACFHSETKDVSDLSTLTFCTMKEKNLSIRMFLTHHLLDNPDLNFQEDLVLHLPFLHSDSPDMENKISLYFNVIEYNDIGSRVVLSREVMGNEKQLTLPRNTFQYNKNYQLQYRTDEDSYWEVLLVTFWR